MSYIWEAGYGNYGNSTCLNLAVAWQRISILKIWRQYQKTCRRNIGQVSINRMQMYRGHWIKERKCKIKIITHYHLRHIIKDLSITSRRKCKQCQIIIYAATAWNSDIVVAGLDRRASQFNCDFN